MPKVPFADALIAVARDHFTFLTAGEEDQQPGDVETRMGKIEETLQRILAQLPAPKGPAPTAAPLVPAAKSKAGVPGKKPSASPAPAAGLDPTMMQQALQAGVSPEALGEVMSLVGSRPPGKIAPQAVQDAVELTSDEDGSGACLAARRIWLCRPSRARCAAALKDCDLHACREEAEEKTAVWRRF